MKKKNMLAGISAVALTLASAGCAPNEAPTSASFGTNQSVSTEAQEDLMEQQSGFDDCEQMELVQGDAYSGSDEEVWYCTDENHSEGGSFFVPFLAGYFTASALQSKHGMNVSSYKPGSSKRVISKSDYNKSAKKPLPSIKTDKPKVDLAKPKTQPKTKKQETSASPVSGSAPAKSKTVSSPKSSGFGSKSFSSGG